MNSKRKATLPIFTTCFASTFAALIIVSLLGAAHFAYGQNAPAETVIRSFRPATGQDPANVVTDAAGNLYVATRNGGNNQKCPGGCGNVLMFSSSGQPKTLFTFTPSRNGSQGPFPTALARDAQGNLYATTQFGGQSPASGAVYKLTPSGSAGILYSFAGGEDGQSPFGGVTSDSVGNLYGTTISGGGTGCSSQSGCGVIYKITPSRIETVLYRFSGGTDGGSPVAKPVLDATGSLYGTAALGGDLSCALAPGTGCGTVWKLDIAGNFTVLYAFTGGADGAFPDAGVLMDSSGNLYGAAADGGDLSCNVGFGCGVVFEIDSSGGFNVLYTFLGGSSDGEIPNTTLVRDSSGNLYGTTVQGGDLSCVQNEFGCGVVFKLDPSGQETILHAFTGGATDGAGPQSPLITDGKGSLYGTTEEGGAADGGVIFKVQMQ
jgi:uncharacterized repeat protein (TIGR03803 family)